MIVVECSSAPSSRSPYGVDFPVAAGKMIGVRAGAATPGTGVGYEVAVEYGSLGMLGGPPYDYSTVSGDVRRVRALLGFRSNTPTRRPDGGGFARLAVGVEWFDLTAVTHTFDPDDYYTHEHASDVGPAASVSLGHLFRKGGAFWVGLSFELGAAIHTGEKLETARYDLDHVAVDIGFDIVVGRSF